MAVLQDLIKDCLTGKDGVSYDIGRILGAVMIVAFLAISVYVYTCLKQPFDPISWGTGGGGLFTGIGAHLMLKAKTEPDQ
jgi:hypothetical protein